ncbi:MAG: Yip1 family protein, partial [Caulobacteraceae bacterium]
REVAMSIVDNGSGKPSSLVERVKGILLKPNEEWNRIDGEPATVQGLYTGYICILAAIPAVASFIGGQIFGYGAFLVHFKPPLITSLVTAILTYVMSLVMVFVMAIVIEALAPSFDGEKNRIQALKVAGYSYTAAWVAGVLQIIPALGVLAVLGGLYSLYLLYIGLPKLMKSPPEKALGYTIVSIIVAAVLAIVVSMVVAAVSGAAMLGAGLGSGLARAPAADGVLSVGGASVDLGKLQAASKQMEASAKQMQAATSGAAASGTGTVQIVPGETLKSLLPQVGGYTRSEISSASGGAAGIGGSNAEATYQKGSSSLTVEITDLGAAGGIAGLASAFQVNSNKESSTGYEKVSTVGGRMTTEEYNTQSKSGKYGVLIASRFMVEAHGNDVAMNDLKGVVGSIDLGRLESLAK